MKDADMWFSRYIRIVNRKYMSQDGEVFCNCYTCGSIKKATRIQCGHFIRREFKATRYHELNCKPQCIKCNYYRSGQFEVFERRLEKEISDKGVAILKELSLKSDCDNREFFQEMLDTYKAKTLELVEKHGIKKWW